MKEMILTQDTLQGHAIIEQLQVDELSAGQHHFWFKALNNGIAQDHLIPVVVFKGTETGPKVMVTAGLHGDELNGVITAQKVIQSLESQTVRGCVIVVPTLNISGVLMHTRDFIPSDPDSSPANLNRLFPGKASGNSADRYVNAIWERLLGHNTDLAIDLHTQTRGATYPLYIFADYRIEQTVKMARLMNPDAIFNDPGDAGVLETQWNTSGVPCITVEVGSGILYEADYVSRAVDGIHNILKAENVLAGEISAATLPTVEGDETITVRAEIGGFAIPQVAIGDNVKQGDLLSIQYDNFGNESRRYEAPSEGYVLSLNQDTLREPGTLLVRLLK